MWRRNQGAQGAWGGGGEYSGYNAHHIALLTIDICTLKCWDGAICRAFTHQADSCGPRMIPGGAVVVTSLGRGRGGGINKLLSILRCERRYAVVDPLPRTGTTFFFMSPVCRLRWGRNYSQYIAGPFLATYFTVFFGLWSNKVPSEPTKATSTLRLALQRKAGVRA